MGMLVNPFASGKLSYPDEVMLDVPTMYWRHNDTSGTTAADSSGNGRAGTISPTAVSLGATGLLPSEPSTPSMQILGVEDSQPVSIGGATWSNTAQATSEAVINVASLAHNCIILCNESNGAQRYRFYVANTGALVILARIPSTLRTVASAAGAIVPGTTYHVAWTFDGTTLRVFKNGVDIGNAVWSGSLASNTDAVKAGNFGAQSVNECFDGRIQETALYNYALSPARLLAHTNAM